MRLYKEMNNIDASLVKELTLKVKPIYEKSDISHNMEFHIQPVIRYALQIAEAISINRKENINYNIVFAAAILHDITRPTDKENHELSGGKVVRKLHSFLSKWFNNAEIEIIAQAVEDHRASSKDNPRTIYGEIISDADRMSSFSIDVLITRTWYFRRNNSPELNTKEKIFESMYNHMVDKYGEGGYAKLLTLEANKIAKLAYNKLQNIIANKEKVHEIFNDMINKGILKW